MKCPACGHEFRDPTKVAGGLKSRRKLSKKEARRIAKLGWAKRKKEKPE